MKIAIETTHDLLYEALGLRLLKVWVDGREKPEVLRTQAEVEDYLTGRATTHFTEEERDAVHKAAKEAGLLNDFRTVMEYVRDFKLPDAMDMEGWEFRALRDRTHGSFFHKKIEQSPSFECLKRGMIEVLFVLDVETGSHHFTPMIAIRLLQQMITSGLPLTPHGEPVAKAA